MCVAALVVAAMHLGIVAFMTLAPFSSDPHVLLAHVLLTPFLWIHWALNDDTCFLTLVECKLRGLEPTQSFMHRLVSPVYKIQDADVQTASWLVSIVLWIVSLARYFRRF